MFPLLLILQTAPAITPPPASVNPPARYAECLGAAAADPAAGQSSAIRWRIDGGGMFAWQCLGVAYSNAERWDAAAGAFEEAAKAGVVAKNPRAGVWWVQTGNAWLSAGDPAKARAAFDTALSSGLLGSVDMGEAYLDRARAQVAQGETEGARADLDNALLQAPEDPLAWLLSATLARRMNDLPRARKDIAEALTRSPDDSAVQLEAGNIAVLARDEAGARTAWTRAIELAPGSPTAAHARKALEQFGATEK